MSSLTTIVAHLDCGPEEARRCLATLAARSAAPESDVIVVDDGAPGVADVLDDLPADTAVIRNERREGLISSAEIAARQSVGDVLILLRGAPELDPNAVSALAAALADPGLRAVAAALPLQPDSHPACTHALAFRRQDAGCLSRVVGATPGFELAALCAELAAGGPIKTLAGSVARPAHPRSPAARGEVGAAAELTVVVPTLDAAAERVRDCVAALQARTESPHQIVLVDNGAPPQGFTAPVNAGLRAVDTPYTVVMNDDVEVMSGWWPPLKDALDRGAPVVFPLTLGSWIRTDFAAWCFAMTRESQASLAHAPGEFFDPAMRVWYQDTDLLTRLRERGEAPQFVRESQIRHEISTTVESEDPELKAWIAEKVKEDHAAFQRKHPSVTV